MRRPSIPGATIPPDSCGVLTFEGHIHRTSIEESPRSNLELRAGKENLTSFEDGADANKPQRRGLFFDCCLLGAISMSQLLDEYFLSGFVILVPKLTKEFSIPDSSTTWPASAYSLAVSAFLLLFGRFSDAYGSFLVLSGGLIWLTIWSLVGGFVSSEIMLDISRAMQGLAAAAYLPSSLSMLNGMVSTSLPNSNLIFFIYGAMAPLGTFLGILLATLTLQFANWRWFFWIGSMMAGVTSVLVVLLGAPQIHKLPVRRVGIDWLGSGLFISGLILSIFAITQVSHASQGWHTWYIPTTLALGLCLLGAFSYVEMKIAKHPVIPKELWKIPSLPAFSIGLLFNYGTTNVFLLYATL